MVNVILTYSPKKMIFPVGERIFPVGKVGVVVVYPDLIVGVWGRRPGGWENRIAFDPVPFRGLLRAAPAGALSAVEAAAQAPLAGDIGSLRLPRLMVRVPQDFDPADANQEALERASGSKEGGNMLSTFVESIVRGPNGLLVPREFVLGPVELKDVFEDVGELVKEGTPVYQAVRLEDVVKAGLGRLAFTKKAIAV